MLVSDDSCNNEPYMIIDGLQWSSIDPEIKVSISHDQVNDSWLGWHKLENEILKKAKKAQKWHFLVSKWSFLVIFQGF